MNPRSNLLQPDASFRHTAASDLLSGGEYISTSVKPTLLASHRAENGIMAVWPEGPEVLALEPGQIHVWSLLLDVPVQSVTRLERILSHDEVARAARFRFPLHRNRFIAGRGSLRELLGRYLAAPAEKIQFVYGPHGKPDLGAVHRGNGLHFNLAHSEGLALVAVTCAGPVGIDLEWVHPIK